jgi:hypothetical protein
MERKPRSSFLRLLSEPGFNFTPYFDKAVVEWLERNMGDFIKEAPEACVYFTKEPDYQALVAQYIQIKPENDKLITDFMKEFNTGWNSTTALEYIAPRLAEVGKSDMVLNCIETLRTMQNVVSIVGALSEEAVVTLADSIDWNHLRWNAESRCALIKRLPKESLMKVDPDQWNWYDENTKPRALITMATKWPLEEIGTFLSKYGTRWTALSCMGCGEKTAKSKPGYTLHRKSCDPENKYPNIWTVIAERAR